MLLKLKTGKARISWRLGGVNVVALACLSLVATEIQAATGASNGAYAAPPEIIRTPSCRGEVGIPESIKLAAGKSRFVRLSQSVTRLTLGNDKVVDAKLISPTSLYLVGSGIGDTNLILQGKHGCTVYEIVVRADPAVLEATLEDVLGGTIMEGVKVQGAGDMIVLSGTVPSAVVAQQIESIAQSYLTRTARNIDVIGPSGGGGTSISISGDKSRTKASSLLVNMMTVAAPQQVLLEVKVAEVSKNLLDKIGATFAASRSNGWGSVAILSDLLTGTAAGTLGILKPRSYSILLDAEKKDGLVRILAEPNVMAISGRKGSFLAGGKILIPVSQSSANGGVTIGLEEKEFGVGLEFTPTVLGDGRINLEVAPEVSELSRDGVGVTATGTFNGTAVLPLITTRRAKTTVQLFDGQSFAIGGLIKNSATANVNAFPFLGEIPVLGALFRSTDFQSEKSELVFVVTPHLVKPLPADYELPTDRIGEPDRNGVMLRGRIDTDPPETEMSGDAGAGPAGFDVK